MAFKICDPADLIPGKVFSEEKFLQAVKDYDWEKYRGRLVLVRGCGSAVIPPWAFMLITVAAIITSITIFFITIVIL